MPGLNRCRDISRSPKLDIRPTCIRARSFFSFSFKRFSTELLFRLSSISIKSITIRPAKSLRRSCRATSSEASKFVLRAVSSIDASLVALPELTSIATSASVMPITIYPPDFSWTVGLNIPLKKLSTW